MPDLRPEGCKRICKDGHGRSKGGIKKSLRDELQDKTYGHSRKAKKCRVEVKIIISKECEFTGRVPGSQRAVLNTSKTKRYVLKHRQDDKPDSVRMRGKGKTRLSENKV